MSTVESDNNSPDPINSDDDLDTFAAEFFGRNKSNAPEEQSTPEVTDSAEEDTDAPEDETVDTQSSDEDDDTLAPDDDDDNDETKDESEETPKPKKNRFQERIDELTGKARNNERRAEAAEREAAELRAKLEALSTTNNNKDTPKQEADQPANSTNNDGPDPFAKNEDGSDKYPLGEFDPKFISDLARFQVQQEFEQIKARERMEAEQKKLEEQQAVAVVEWQNKLESARERYPDFEDKSNDLVEAVGQIDHLTKSTWLTLSCRLIMVQMSFTILPLVLMKSRLS